MANLVTGSWKEPHTQLSLSHSFCNPGQCPYGPSGALGYRNGHHHGHSRGYQPSPEDSPPQATNARFHLLQGEGDADEAYDVRTIENGDRHVEHIVAQGTAEAHTGALTMGEGALHLRSVEVIFHLASVFVGFADDSAISGDDGDASTDHLGVPLRRDVEILP
jgi:hypothetical protein